MGAKGRDQLVGDSWQWETVMLHWGRHPQTALSRLFATSTQKSFFLCQLFPDEWELTGRKGTTHGPRLSLRVMADSLSPSPHFAVIKGRETVLHHIHIVSLLFPAPEHLESLRHPHYHDPQHPERHQHRGNTAQTRPSTHRAAPTRTPNNTRSNKAALSAITDQQPL